jgi:hypothetical protein
VALPRVDVSEEHIACIIRVAIIGEIGTLAATEACCKEILSVCSVIQLLVTTNVVPSWPIIFTLMMEAICSSETLVRTRATWHNIPEDGILQIFWKFCRSWGLLLEN